MTLFNTIFTAWSGIMGNKLRATLTTLGIVIGVASVISMLALGNGARAAVDANFRYLGSDMVQISVKEKIDQGELVPIGEILSFEDGLQMPEAVPLVQRVIMSVGGEGKIRRDRNVLDMGVLGTTADGLANLVTEGQVQPVAWPDGVPLTPEGFLGNGRFFTPSEVIANADVCVLGHKTAADLFEGDEPLDELIWVNRRKCLVIGVLAELEVINPSLRNQLRPNEVLYLPISTAILNLFDEEPSVGIIARVSDEAQMATARQQIISYLRQRHGVGQDELGDYEDDFELTTRQEILGAQQAAARTFSFLLAAMATVSLVVGGIGIMNVMLVSVTERTREIGVRLAVGAQQGDIVRQFLLEAVLISAAGGVLGTAVGILTVPLAASLNRGVALLDPASIPLAFGVALLTGLVFGLYPAVRASRLDPIEALRYE
ncbi:ABC transporter permease [Candidatus Leptofilum sp.]|uniref:ABC transporter permease n=1 Tax=Candidatus Leptofilum sp. TaxID=3241576 RepID=UPI003B5A20EC